MQSIMHFVEQVLRAAFFGLAINPLDYFLLAPLRGFFLLQQLLLHVVTPLEVCKLSLKLSLGWT